MSIILPFVLISLAYSLVMFFICENKSLQHKKITDLKCLEYDVKKVYVCLEKYQTFKYAGIFFILIFIYTLIIAYLDFVPHNLGLIEIIAYIALTAFLGSLYILIFKWNKGVLIKVFSSLMFGSIFIASSAVAFVIAYLIFG